MLVSLVGEFCQRIYQLAQGLPFYKLRDLDEEERTARSQTSEGPVDVPYDTQRTTRM